MDIKNPTPSQGAVILRKFLSGVGYNVKLAHVQEGLARANGYTSFQALVANEPHRGHVVQSAAKLESTAGDLLWVVSGRNSGDDDDTVELLWAPDEGEAHLEFKLRMCDYSDRPEKDAFADQESLHRPIFICWSSLVGRLVNGQLVLENDYLPPQRDPKQRDIGSFSAEELESHLRAKYEGHPEYNDPEEGGGDFLDMVKLFAGEPRYSLHEAAVRYLALTKDAAPAPVPVYWVHRAGSIYELRQIRYREQFKQGTEHPHDLCAVARSVDELRGMVEQCKLGPVDWAVLAD